MKDKKMEKITLSDNEYKLLFLTSVKELSESQKAQIEQILTNPLDWNIFSELLQQHRNYPLVFQSFKKIGKTNKDIPILDKLEQMCKKNTIKSLKLTSGLITIVSLFEQNKIPVISLKGPALAQSVFGNVGLRTSSDLDVLVDIKDLDRAMDLLIADGFKIEHFRGELTAKKKKSIIKNSHHFVFNRNGLNIELHWSFSFLTYRFRFSSLWQHSRTVKISGKEIPVLSEEDEFLFLVFHGAKHGWQRLKWLCDIVEIIKKDQLNWDLILDKAKEYDILHILAQTIIIANRFYNIEIPVAFQSLVQNNKLADKLVKLAEPIILGAAQGSFSYKIYAFKMYKNIHQKIVFIATHFMPQSVDYMENDIGDRYFFIYFLIRPFGRIIRFFKEHFTTKKVLK